MNARASLHSHRMRESSNAAGLRLPSPPDIKKQYITQ
jgi:hypothetical protein